MNFFLIFTPKKEKKERERDKCGREEFGSGRWVMGQLSGFWVGKRE